MSSIFKINALDYLRKGYAVIPDKQGSKAPAIMDWVKYSSRMPNLEEINNWVEIKDTNIALMLGESSGIVALDLDTDDEHIMSQIAHLLPPSPVERKGSKGWMRFFRYSGENSQEIFETYLDLAENKQKKRVVLELLSHGKKATIPPSIHPKGMEYKWTGKSLLEVNKEDLPLLPSNLMSTIASKLKMEESSFNNTARVSSGRNSVLGTACARVIEQQQNIEQAIDTLIQEDKKVNDSPLFSDGEEFKTKIALINAGKFYFNYLESINMKREKQGLLPELPIKILKSIEEPKSEEASKVKEEFLLPEPTGSLKLITDYILKKSYVEQPTFALSAALTLLGGLASRKMIFQNTSPNVYILNVGESGSGKDSCQQAIKTLLKAAKASGLIGASSYPSEASIMAFLSQQPVRIDVIDEASSFLKAASSGGAPYQTGIGDLLCELYSCSNDHFLGKVLASDGGKRVGACYRPNLNIICSTTFRGVSEGISQSTLEKGLFARFLTFFGDENKPAKRIKDTVNVPNELSSILEHWSTWRNPKATGNIDENIPAYEVGISKEADLLLDSYFYKLDELKCTPGKSLIMKPIVARLYQQMLKIVLISAVSNAKIHHVPVVEVKDVEFGYQFIRYFYSNIEEFIENTLHDNDREKNVNKILHLIKKAGKKGINNMELVKQSKSIRPNERLEIVKDLVEGQQVIRKEKIINNNVIHVFNYIGE